MQQTALITFVVGIVAVSGSFSSVLRTGLCVASDAVSLDADPLASRLNASLRRIKKLGRGGKSGGAKNTAAFDEAFGVEIYNLLYEAKKKLDQSQGEAKAIFAATLELAAELTRFDGSLAPGEAIVDLQKKWPKQFTVALNSLSPESKRSIQRALAVLEPY